MVENRDNGVEERERIKKFNLFMYSVLCSFFALKCTYVSMIFSPFSSF